MTSPLALHAADGPLLADGATATELIRRGLPAGTPPEIWNLERPDEVRRLHRAYIAAGSDIVLTNSFGGNRFRLRACGIEHSVQQVNHAAATLARAAAGEAGRPVLVAGAMGPTGLASMRPGVPLPRAVSQAFADQASALAGAGVDVLWIETMYDLDELVAAVEAARSACDLDVVTTVTVDHRGRLPGGSGMAEFVERVRPLALAAVGVNCGDGPVDVEPVVGALCGMVDSPVVVKANAGLPHQSAAGLAYDVSPLAMAAHARRMIDAGAAIIGGCCGVGPDHIAAMRRALEGRDR